MKWLKQKASALGRRGGQKDVHKKSTLLPKSHPDLTFLLLLTKMCL